MDGSVLEEKSSFKMPGLTFSSKLDWGSYIISIAKTASKKIEALIHSMKFLSPEVALYLYKSTIHPSMEYQDFPQVLQTWGGSSKFDGRGKLKSKHGGSMEGAQNAVQKYL